MTNPNPARTAVLFYQRPVLGKSLFKIPHAGTSSIWSKSTRCLVLGQAPNPTAPWPRLTLQRGRDPKLGFGALHGAPANAAALSLLLQRLHRHRTGGERAFQKRFRD